MSNRLCRHCGDIARRKTCPICSTALGNECYGCHIEKAHGFVFRRDVPALWLNIARRKSAILMRGSGINAVIDASVFKGKEFVRPSRFPEKIGGIRLARKELRELSVEYVLR